GRQLPPFVWRELERFKGCGDPRRGFAWLVCRPCQHHRLVPFSCGGRGFCPSCGGRRMASLAAHWVDHVLPEVGLRQWVVTVPWRRRWLLSRRHELARAVLVVAIGTMQRIWPARLA
ncbi:MAG: IS91 family transposase, partial [bacterium]|nr:IS91 family transposase [bacterium]